MGMQAVLHMIYPPQCLSCDALVTTDHGLCADCWRETPFISGPVCDCCGVPIAGSGSGGGPADYCDDCLQLARPWDRGRAALLYKGNARRMILQLKHGDRLDLVPPAAAWMQRAARVLLMPNMLLAPVPLHWFRLLQRRYNQAALLSAALAKRVGLAHCPDLLIRARSTGSQEGRSREGRYVNMADALQVHPRRAPLLKDRHVLLVDDVMTSGATLTVAADACLAAGAAHVSVLVLARVAKEP